MTRGGGVKIRTVEFVGSIGEVGAPPPRALPQVAVSGRSNVGKSSLINCLVRRTRRRLAQISGRPGKTRRADFYLVNDAFLLVDLPGLGYARVPRTTRERWARLIQGYIGAARDLRGVAHLVDARHPPSREDRSMIEFLAGRALPVLVVLTKIDKVPRSRRSARVEALAQELRLDHEQLLPFSARTGEGRTELLAAIGSLLDRNGGDHR